MAVLWYTVPIAVVLALSVFPIVAVLLLLLAPSPLVRSVPFAVGFIIGVVVLVSAFALAAKALPGSSGRQSPPWSHVAEIIVGACLVVFAVVLMIRPSRPSSMNSSKLADATDKLTKPRSFGFGMLMNVRPKSLVLTLAAGLAIGTAPIDLLTGGLTVLVFAVVAGSTVAGLVVAYAIGTTHVRPGLEWLRNYLTSHAEAVLRFTLLGLGVVLVVVGIVRLVTG